MFVDSHCHLDFPDLIVQVDDILSRMQTNRVSHALCVSVNLPDWPGIMKLVEQHDCLWASVGVHPDYEDTVEPTVEDLVSRTVTGSGNVFVAISALHAPAGCRSSFIRARQPRTQSG